MFMKKNVETIMKSIRLDKELSLAMTQLFECPTVAFSADDYGVAVWVNDWHAGVCGTDLESRKRLIKYLDARADAIRSDFSKLDHMEKINLVLTVLVSFIAECEGIDLAA